MRQKYSREELIWRFAKAVKTARLVYGVGGATAMAEYGYSRFTKDVDVFVLESGRAPLMTALRNAGLEIFVVADPSHYAAKIPGDPDSEQRIDILVAWGEPEESAIEHARLGKLGLKVFLPDLLAMVKFYAYDDSGDAKHLADLIAMHRRGIFDAKLVRDLVASVDPERLSAYDRVVANFVVTSAARPRPVKRLPKSKIRRK